MNICANWRRMIFGGLMLIQLLLSCSAAAEVAPETVYFIRQTGVLPLEWYQVADSNYLHRKPAEKGVQSSFFVSVDR